jgi:hypothetical protein
MEPQGRRQGKIDPPDILGGGRLGAHGELV